MIRLSLFRSVFVMFFLSAFAGVSFAQWPMPQTAMQAYDFVQGRRAEAEKLWNAKDPAGIDLLLKTLPYLDQPLVKDLSAGNPYLATRRLNIYMDLAQAYVLQGKTTESLAYLRKVAANASPGGLADYYDKLKAFDALRDNPEFRGIMDDLRKFNSFWEPAALKTPYRQNVSDAEKIAGLSKFWSEVKYNFAFPERLVVLNWDQLYLDWIPRVLATTSTVGYYRELTLLSARLNDGHTNIYAPAQADINSRPPLRTGLIDDRVMILDVRSAALEAKGVHAGMEIVAVDGENAISYGKRAVEPFVNAATPQDREVRTYWYGFLRGPSAQPVRLALRDSAGKQTVVEVSRSGFTDVRAVPPFEWRMLDGNIAYVALNSFESSQTVDGWRKAFPEISRASGIVLDVRVNGGGDTSVGFDILRDLVAAPFTGSRSRLRKYNPTDRARGFVMEFVDLEPDTVQPAKNTYTRPVVVLAGPATYSAAEDFLVAWKNSGRGKLIGEQSGGSTGQPLSFTLPGGGSARVCTKKDSFPDGTEWVGYGIEPDIVAKPTVADVQAGRDAALARAQAYLSSSPGR
jgi:carboxyl-terminal processing protease